MRSHTNITFFPQFAQNFCREFYFWLISRKTVTVHIPQFPLTFRHKIQHAFLNDPFLFIFLLPDRSCSWQACPRLVSFVDLSRSFDWIMLVEMAWMVDTWASMRFEASSMVASLLTSSWFPNKMFFSFRTSNWLSKRRNSSLKKEISLLSLILYLT